VEAVAAAVALRAVAVDVVVVAVVVAEEGMKMQTIRTKLMTKLMGAIFVASLTIGLPQAHAQQAFDSPVTAAKALVDAARSPAPGTLDRIFGPGAAALLNSGDPETDKTRIASFLDLAEKGQSVTDGEGGRKVLVFGASGWRFPIPLRASNGAWTFDLAAGKQAVIDRKIGLNELAAIGACADYVAAQNEYRATLHDDEPVQQYARKLISTPGKHDGLFWEPASAADRSPLGDRITRAIDKGANGKAGSYRGYVFRILTGQGADAPGGAYSYMAGGRMLAGFALLAYPAAWGETGVMTFQCDQRGRVYQSNLGPNTQGAVRNITLFNAGQGWSPVDLQN
jgi:hypothetical protein